MTQITASIQHAADTEANWDSNNPVLLPNQIYFSTDKYFTNSGPKFKVGRGDHWRDTPYFLEEDLDDLWLAILAKESQANKGQAGGYASLDNNAKIPLHQMPDAVLGNVKYKGNIDCNNNVISSSDPAYNGNPLPAASLNNEGHYLIVIGAAFAGNLPNIGNIDVEPGDWIISTGTSWQIVDNVDAVKTVNGQKGNVTITPAGIGAQPALGYTPEDVANKATSLASPNNTTYPTTQVVADNVLHTWTSSSVFTQGQKFIWRSIFGDLRIYEVLPGQTLNAGETPFTNPEKVEMVTDWLDAGMVHRWHSSAIWWNFTKVLSFDNGAANPGSPVTPVIGNGQTINSLGCRIQTAQTSGSTGRMSLYRIDSQIIGNAAYTATLIHDGGEFSTDTTGVKTVVITDTVLRKGELYLVLITNSNTSGSWQRMTFDLSFLGFNLTSGSITRYVHFIAQTLSSSGITDPTLPAQTNIRVLPASGPLPTAFVR